MNKSQHNSTIDDYPHFAVGERLRAMREYLGIEDQKEFAKLHNFNYLRYHTWESGRRRIPPDQALILLNKYGLSLDFIYGGKFSALPQSLAAAFSDKPKDK